MVVGVYLVFILCTLLEMTNSRTSTMWKLNDKTGLIENNDVMEDSIHNYPSVDENILYNFNAMADVYSGDKTFFTIVSSMRSNNYNSWLRQSAANTLESLLQTRKLKNIESMGSNNYKTHPFQPIINGNNKTAQRNDSQNLVTLDCGQPVNYTNYDYIINLRTDHNQKETPIMPEPEVIYFFLKSHDQDNYRNFSVEALEKRLIYLKKQKPLSAEIFHQIGNYWRIIGKPIQAIKCFRRSLDITPAASEVMYDLAKVLYNLQYLDDAINMARRSIEFQTPRFAAWRQYLLLGDIMKSYGDLRGSVHYYRLALELNPTQGIILKSLSETDQPLPATLHVYTIVIIVILVMMVLIVILTLMITEVRTDHHHYTNSNCLSNSEMYDIKQQRHFNRNMTIRSLKGLSTSTRSTRQRKY